MSNPTSSKTFVNTKNLHASWAADREAWLKRESIQKIEIKDKHGTVISTEYIERGPRYVEANRLKKEQQRREQ